MIIFIVYLLQGNHIEKVLEYLYTNWFEMVKPLNTDYKKQDSFDAISPMTLPRKNSLQEIDEEGRMEEEEEAVGPSERHIHALKLYAINCG